MAPDDPLGIGSLFSQEVYGLGLHEVGSSEHSLLLALSVAVIGLYALCLK